MLFLLPRHEWWGNEAGFNNPALFFISHEACFNNQMLFLAL
jgi:hypothetical protein